MFLLVNGVLRNYFLAKGIEDFVKGRWKSLRRKDRQPSYLWFFILGIGVNENYISYALDKRALTIFSLLYCLYW